MTKKTKIKYKVVPAKYVSYTEITRMTGYTRSYLRVLKSRGVMPPTVHPEYPVWLRQDIETWVLLEGRATDADT